MSNLKEVTPKLVSTEKLYFLRDLSFSMGDQVYSGHSGTGKKFQMYQSDYGKYAMNPMTFDECVKLREKIIKDAKGTCEFKWDIVPCYKIQLCNFYEDKQQSAYEQLREQQALLFDDLI